MRTRTRETWAVGLLIGAFLVLNLLFLTRYPLVHSDESWLGGLTRNMMAVGSAGVTEPFFDLKPRYPHAIKILFHILQMPFISVFGYRVFALRLLSLIAGSASLLLIYRCCRALASFSAAWLTTAAFALNAQFIAASHTARQEILLFLMMLWLMQTMLHCAGHITPRDALRLGLITGLSVGLHPNSFLLAVGCGVTLVLFGLLEGKVRVRVLLTYIATTGLVAMVFVGLSFTFDPQFPAHYRRYGETEFDLDATAAEKLGGFPDYLRKLWLGVSGTYVLPDLRLQLILCAALAAFGIFRVVRQRDAASAVPLGMGMGAMLATAGIGRYNQLSACLWMLPLLLLLAPALSGIRTRTAPKVAYATVCLGLLLGSVQAVSSAMPYDYGAYLSQLSAFVRPDQKALANLNTGFYFDNDALLDVRNLSYLKENNLTFAEYVRSRGIEVILWPQEMDYLYEHRPTYNALYGNPRATPEVHAFLKDHCTLLGTLENSGYAVRLVSEIGKPYTVSVYRVNPQADSEENP